MSTSDIAISVAGLSKRYRLGLKEKENNNFISALRDTIISPIINFKKHRSLYKFSEQEIDESVIWALRDISFEVKRGEVLGIIGTNGSGKSTLLKVLSHITPPTLGEIHIRGRVSSLLEVGTGFHPELTGRENVYLNATILGMRKKEVDLKFDEIVMFSGIEKFLDTPVKRYSSGMRVRLAFAVAAHLEPEILIIDEVLAVGDSAFQKKCLDKMEDVSHHGRTVLFVSHNMPAVTRLCQRAILLDQGKLLKDGSAHEVVSNYLTAGLGVSAEKVWPDLEQAPGDNIVKLRAVRARTDTGEVRTWIDIRRPFGLEMEYEVLEGGRLLLPYYNIFNDEGIKVCTAIDQDIQWRRRLRQKGRYVSTVWFPGNLLNEGFLYISPSMRTLEPMHMHFRVKDAIAFQLIDTVEGDSARGDFIGDLDGAIRPLLEWNTSFETGESGTFPRKTG